LIGRSNGQTFNVGANFRTMTGGEVQYTPPDTQGAAGQNNIVIFNNGRYKSFSKLGTQIQSQADTTFFSNAGYAPTGGDQNIRGDPRVRFDPLSGRWFIINLTDGFGGGGLGLGVNNRIVIAVSSGADPTGPWKATYFESTIDRFADYPTLAIDKNGVYIGTNNFDDFDPTINVSLFTMNKSGLLWTGSGSPTLTNFTAYEGMSLGTRGSTLQATNNYDVNQSGNTNRVVGGLDSTHRTTWTINNTGGSTNLGDSTPFSVATQNNPPTAQQSGGNDVQALDNRIGGQSVQMGNFIYFANGFDNGTGRAQVRFTVLNAATGAVVQEGNFSDPSLAYFFPCIAVNESGQAVIGFSGSNSSTFIGSYAAVGTINQATGAIFWGSAQLVAAGQSAYTGYDSPTVYRWGDYSAVTVDPADTGIFWSFQERTGTLTDGWDPTFTTSGNISNYATQATEIIPSVAGQVRWKIAANGAYASAANWFNGVAPGASSHAIYSRNGAPFTVTLPAGTTSNDRISVRQGTVTFNIPTGATYQATNTSAATPSFTVSQMLGDSTVTITGGGTFSSVYTTLAAGENGLTTDNISKGTVTVTGAGTTWNNSRDVYFGGNATRSGGAGIVNINAGALVNIGEVARFWTSTSGINMDGTTMNVGGLRADSGVAPTISAISGATIRITDGLGQTYFGAINGSLSIIKNGAGTQTLSGPMSYSGLTFITNGRLNINGAKTGTGSVTVSNGATLGGNGSVAGPVTINSGGRVAPGMSAGNLTFTGGLTMMAGTYQWELAALTTAGAGNNYDLITINGGASTLGGTSQVQLQFIGTAFSPDTVDAFWMSPHQWLITDLVSGSLTGIYTSITNPNFFLGRFSLSGGNGDVFLNYVFAPIPEPASLTLTGLAMVGYLVFHRRRGAARG